MQSAEDRSADEEERDPADAEQDRADDQSEPERFVVPSGPGAEERHATGQDWPEQDRRRAEHQQVRPPRGLSNWDELPPGRGETEAEVHNVGPSARPSAAAPRISPRPQRPPRPRARRLR
jgi:hypothetical protein